MPHLSDPTHAQEDRPETARSVSTYVTPAEGKDHQIPDVSTMPSGRKFVSSLPDDKQSKLSTSDDNWEHDPANPRNWSTGKKWVCIRIQSHPACTK
jgi:hypothetical protein